MHFLYVYILRICSIITTVCLKVFFLTYAHINSSCRLSIELASASGDHFSQFIPRACCSCQVWTAHCHFSFLYLRAESHLFKMHFKIDGPVSLLVILILTAVWKSVCPISNQNKYLNKENYMIELCKICMYLSTVSLLSWDQTNFEASEYCLKRIWICYI